ncbi:MAG: hypothetical protein Q8838_02770 [Candidatus Phytoplasma australasiaticum]|nr:hypothetical protein [Candidatus Phytoplasma australasiaticum]
MIVRGIDFLNVLSWLLVIERVCALYQTETKAFGIWLHQSILGSLSMLAFTIYGTTCLRRHTKNTKEVRRLFLGLAKAYTVQEFEELMFQMKEISPKCYTYLVKAYFKKWS